MPDFCPAMDKKFADLADRIAAVPGRADKVRLLSVSFDPEHDTPEVLRKHAAMRAAKEPLWTFAVASHPELAKIAGPLGLVYGPTENDIIHNLVTAIIDVNGRLGAVSTRGKRPRAWLRWSCSRQCIHRFPAQEGEK